MHVLKGRKQSAQHIKKRIESLKRNGKLKGRVSNFKGRKHTEEAIEKNRIAHLGNTNRRGGRHTVQAKEQMRQAKLKNPIKYWLGKKRSQQTIDKIKKTKRKNPLIREKSARWKGGISSIIDCFRNGYQNRQWKSDVFTKDGYSCQKCFLKSHSSLVVHHIQSLSNLFYKNNITTLEQAETCEELCNINNGIVLCSNCHDDFHKKYGKGDNNIQQLLEFLK